MGARTALTLLLLCLVAPASASASRMDVSLGGSGRTYVEYRADDGFQNDVTVSQDGTAVVLHDAGERGGGGVVPRGGGEPITYPNECERLDEHTVRCATTDASVHTSVYTG